MNLHSSPVFLYYRYRKGHNKMTRQKLNIPKDKNARFDQVDFVHNMTPTQLKVLVLRLWGNFQDLANAIDPVRPDISNCIDNILDGNSWREKDITQGIQYFILNGQLFEYNAPKNQMRVLNKAYQTFSEPTDGITKDELTKMLGSSHKKKS